jgi:hypothetical protein
LTAAAAVFSRLEQRRVVENAYEIDFREEFDAVFSNAVQR